MSNDKVKIGWYGVVSEKFIFSDELKELGCSKVGHAFKVTYIDEVGDGFLGDRCILVDSELKAGFVRYLGLDLPPAKNIKPLTSEVKEDLEPNIISLLEDIKGLLTQLVDK